MKTTNKNSTCKKSTTNKFGFSPRKRVRSILRLENRVPCPTAQSIPTAILAKLNQTPESVTLQTENERRMAAAGMYANTASLR